MRIQMILVFMLVFLLALGCCSYYYPSRSSGYSNYGYYSSYSSYYPNYFSGSYGYYSGYSYSSYGGYPPSYAKPGYVKNHFG